jgi:2,4-dienoyl-CoA reductase-like NADH-dependent reductase (Old Yellow Enzyme family)
MAELFEQTMINNLTLRNRFVRSATVMGMAESDGSCRPQLVDAMRDLAVGGVGLIITGISSVQKGGRSMSWQLACHDDEFLPGLTDMVSAVHEEDGKIAQQIMHCGVFSNPDVTGEDSVGPSPMETEDGPVGRRMTMVEIRSTVEAFAAAAKRTMIAGFDAVQIHGAHGFLLSQFLSPFFNRREDEYGGSLENRARMLLEVVGAVRETVGTQYPVLIKLNSEDLLENGLTIVEMLQVAAMLEKAGVDAIELSGGTSLGLYIDKYEITPTQTVRDKVYWQDAAVRYKEKLTIPLMLVGGIRSIETAEELVGEGITDYISLCRPLIREPALINRWKSGDRRPSECISDNGCFTPGMEGQGVRCVRTDAFSSIDGKNDRGR